MLYRIRYQGKQWLLVGTPTLGAIITMEDYEGARPSYAMLRPDGVIRRFGKDIGTRAEIEFLGEIFSPPPKPPDVKDVLGSIPRWVEEARRSEK